MRTTHRHTIDSHLSRVTRQIYHVLPLWRLECIYFGSPSFVLMLILLFQNFGCTQVVKTVIGALLICMGAQRTIVGAHFGIVGTRTPTKVYKLTPMDVNIRNIL